MSSFDTKKALRGCSACGFGVGYASGTPTVATYVNASTTANVMSIKVQ